jgi:hypothetical protein
MIGGVEVGSSQLSFGHNVYGGAKNFNLFSYRYNNPRGGCKILVFIHRNRKGHGG